MGLMSAFKAFWKAYKNPEEAKKFLEEKEPSKLMDKGDVSHLKLLAQLQQSGRFIDFLKEDISAFSDAQVGAAVRKIHADCSKSIEELVTIRPLCDEQEGSAITVPAGYDPSAIKVIGKVKGEPPFKGVLVHKGWKAQKRVLPKASTEFTPEIICPAEIEIK